MSLSMPKTCRTDTLISGVFGVGAARVSEAMMKRISTGEGGDETDGRHGRPRHGEVQVKAAADRAVGGQLLISARISPSGRGTAPVQVQSDARCIKKE